MKSSIDKLYKFFRLEIERGYDNHAVMGGLERMLGPWEAQARADSLPDELIQVVVDRLHSYAGLSARSRAEALEGIWRRIQRTEGLSESLPNGLEGAGLSGGDAALVDTQAVAEPAAEPPPGTEAHMADEQATKEYVRPALPASQVAVQPQPEARPRPPTSEYHGEPAALDAPVTVLNGVGPRNAQVLGRLGLHTLRDMLFYFPRRYDDYTLLKPINRLQYGEEVTVIATVQNVNLRKVHMRGGEAQIVEALVSDGTGTMRITWYNPYVVKRLTNGAHIVISGKVEQYLGRTVMNNPEWEPLEQQQLSTNRIVPVYGLTAQITQRWLRKIMNQVVTYWAPRTLDPLPADLRRAAGLVDLPTALIQSHFPDSWDDLKAARQRLAFDEIFLLQLGVLRQKQAWQSRTAQVFQVNPEWLAGQLERLPFTLTAAQQRALQDLQHDLASGQPMNRLLQGDVGSGKTVIAALGIAIVANQTGQAALMAPTSILAEQHYKNLLKILAGVGKYGRSRKQSDETIPAPPLQAGEMRLLIGATPESEKENIRQGLESGQVKLIVGTHALIEEPVQFANLELVIVDEQHRFGVEQRSALRAKGANPHLLVMTATPIPRSLALTVYGDLDLSVMDEMPPGRQPIGTYVLLPRERERAYGLIRAQVAQGRQAFIIYPLVEESENSDAKAAVAEHARLQKDYFPELKLGLLHGRLRPEEKDGVMAKFRDGKLHVLVSTSVVEVGVDVPNATVMVIEGANRFGLAQLHQFRGRVGRGAEQSFCVLIPDTPDAAENERLKAMTETNDGFILAERDLEQRGPGQFLGTRQSGFTELRLANLTDIHLIEKARRFAQGLFEQDPELSDPRYAPLKASLERAWGETKGDIS